MERLDDLVVHGLKIYQDDAHFRFGTDAVLLADFIRERRYNNAVDLCSGNGVIPLLLSHGCKGKIVGVEISEKAFLLAEKSAEYNGLSEKISFINADVRKINTKESPLSASAFDLVSVNPPYYAENSGFVADGERGNARTEEEGLLEEIIKAAGRLLKSGGRFCMINRAERLCDVMFLMRKYKVEPKIMKLAETSESRPASLFLIEGRKDAKPGLLFEKPYLLYKNRPYENL